MNLIRLNERSEGVRIGKLEFIMKIENMKSSCNKYYFCLHSHSFFALFLHIFVKICIPSLNSNLRDQKNPNLFIIIRWVVFSAMKVQTLQRMSENIMTIYEYVRVPRWRNLKFELVKRFRRLYISFRMTWEARNNSYFLNRKNSYQSHSAHRFLPHSDDNLNDVRWKSHEVEM